MTERKIKCRRELVSTKEIIFYCGATRFVSIFLVETLSPTFKAIPYFPIVLLSWFLTGYCILRNILQNTVALWVTIFCEILRKIQFAIFTHIQ